MHEKINDEHCIIFLQLATHASEHPDLEGL